MKIVNLKIENFRGIKKAELLFQNHTVIVGDNNIGKSTILEAIDLVLGPERLSRYPIIDEHDFYAGQYLGDDQNKIEIYVEVIVIDLHEEQCTHFRNHLEWYNSVTNGLLEGPPPENTDEQNILPAIRVGFKGFYNEEEDDFSGQTFFLSPPNEDGTFERFGANDKRICGFLFLRTLRTGSRALSLEKGSLLDIILRLRELRPKMWEDVLTELRKITVAEDPELGLSDILSTIQKSVRSFVPAEWAEGPRLKVSALTRVELRKVLTVFMGTGSFDSEGKEYAAPFQHQGTGTINTLVLTLLVMIAELKKNVIFAMEEPEIAIPPHAQKRIINSVISKTAQAIFTSHSPYVLEEFNPSQILVVKRESGIVSAVPADYPPSIKPKKYREEFRRRFCEALLTRRVLIAEGRTEYDAFPVAARRLHELNEEKYSTIEGLGIAVINAETDSQVEPLGKFFRGLGKITFAVFDKQTEHAKVAIEAVVNYPFEAPEKGFEKVILKQTHESALRRYALLIVNNNDWPSHLNAKKPIASMTLEQIQDALFEYFKYSKGEGIVADLIAQCSEEEIPSFIKETLVSIKSIIEKDHEPESGEPVAELSITTEEPIL